jgi:predicted outer membrane repeat protein
MLALVRRCRAMKASSAFVILMFVLLSCGVSAHTWHVTPDGTGDAPTIQAGIDSAAAGDTVALANGTFTGPGNRDIEYYGKAVVICSQDGVPELCIVDCQGSAEEIHRGFKFTSGTGPGSVLEGVTVQNGYWDDGDLWEDHGGGAIHCYEASPTVRNLILCDNFAYLGGGGIECQTLSSPTITNVRFYRNTARGGTHGGGGAIWCRTGCRPVVADCLFEENTSENQGGAIRCWEASPYVRDCTFSSNHSDTYGGAVAVFESQAGFSRVTFYANSAPNGSAVSASAWEPGWVTTFENAILAYGKTSRSFCLSYDAEVLLTCCDIYGTEGADWPPEIEDQYGIRGNFSACPSFCYADDGDFQLCDESPCLPGNHPGGYDCGLVGAWGEGCSCGPTTTIGTTWGGIKSLYRQ